MRRKFHQFFPPLFSCFSLSHLSVNGERSNCQFASLHLQGESASSYNIAIWRDPCDSTKSLATIMSNFFPLEKTNLRLSGWGWNEVKFKILVVYITRFRPCVRRLFIIPGTVLKLWQKTGFVLRNPQESDCLVTAVHIGPIKSNLWLWLL